MLQHFFVVGTFGVLYNYDEADGSDELEKGADGC